MAAVEVCEQSDLPTWLCPHCPEFARNPPASPVTGGRPRPRLAGHWAIRWDGTGHSRKWQGLTAERAKAKPVVVLCDHDEQDRVLCRACTDLLANVLGDVGALLVDLDLAVTRQTTFVEHGTLPGTAIRDESPLAWNERAALARDRLLGNLRAMADAAGVWAGSDAAIASAIASALNRFSRQQQAREWASRITRAVDAAHQAIDRPDAPWFYGPCPACHRDLYGERLDDEDPDAHVICPWPDCTYSAPLAAHRTTQLEAGEDRLLTVSELVGAITSAGETVTRDQINGWIRREGLPREKHVRARLINGKIVTREVYVYRLGDVRRLAREAERKP